MIGPSDDPPAGADYPEDCVVCGAALPEEGFAVTCESPECARLYAERVRIEAEGEASYCADLAAEEDLRRLMLGAFSDPDAKCDGRNRRTCRC